MLGQNNVVTTYRLLSNNQKETYGGTAILTSIDCYLEHASDKVAVMFDGIPAYEVYSLFIEGNQDIIISDKVVDTQGNTYVVKGIKEYDNNMDTCDMTEIVLYRKYTRQACPIITLIVPSVTTVQTNTSTTWTFTLSHETTAEITIMTYDINWGDSSSHSTGTCVASLVKTHSYTTPGLYTGSITITDSKGNIVSQALNAMTVT